MNKSVLSPFKLSFMYTTNITAVILIASWQYLYSVGSFIMSHIFETVHHGNATKSTVYKQRIISVHCPTFSKKFS